MKNSLIVILLSVLTTIVSAQQNYEDVVCLKNGSIIHGIIIEQVPDISIKIETAGRNLFVYRMDEIEKMTKEPIVGESENLKNGSGFKPGYKGIVETGYQFGALHSYSDRFKLNVVNGYQINPYFSVGLGTGIRYYFDSKDIGIPVFADLRTNILDKKISPYLSVEVGYTFDAKDGFKGVGFLLNPTAGVSFKMSDRSALNIGFGYEMQNVSGPLYFYYFEGNPSNKITINTGAITIDMGISF